VTEFVIGKVQEMIQHMITMYQPSLLIVGSRGLSEFKGMLLNSVSKYCLQHSPVPVAVVRPENKLRKSSKKLGGIIRINSGNSSAPSEEEEEEEGSVDTNTTSSKLKRLSFTNKKT
jgi:predicted NBD/HSP70 family sugar kinase